MPFGTQTVGMNQPDFFQRLVLNERGPFEQAAIALALALGFTILRHFIDDGRLGVQFASCIPALLIASILLRPAFTIATAFVSVAAVQWLLIGKRWFDPLDTEHVLVAAMFVTSIVIVVIIGHKLRKSLRRSQSLAEQLSLLNGVLHDRMKGNIGMLHSIVSMAPQDMSDETFRQEVTKRIGGLATASEILRIDNEVLRQLPLGLDRVLAPFDRNGNIGLSGPDLDLDLASAISLTMAVNRLAAESARCGALSTVSGRLDITWAKGANGDLKVGWIEKAPPTDEFCREERLNLKPLPAAAGARFTELADGMRCDFEIVAAPNGAARAA